MKSAAKKRSRPAIGKLISLIAANFAVLLVFYMGSLLVISVGEDVWDATRPFRKTHDPRADSPAYADKLHARQVYADSRKGMKNYQPFIAWRQDPISSPTLTVNKNGYRTHRVGTDNKPGSLKIGFFGGSTMWGVGSDDNHTIPAFFDSLTDNFDVTNYGERGYTSRQNLALLINLINQNKAPDVVVFYDGFNDIWVHCNYATTRSLNGHQEETTLRKVLYDVKLHGTIYRNLVMPFFEFFATLGKRRVISDNLGCSRDAARARAVTDVMIRNWTMAHRLVTGYGGKFHAFLQPNLYVGAPRADHVVLKTKQRGRAGEFRAVYPIMRRKLDRLGADWTFDLTTAFDGNRLIYVDDAHVAPQGNRIIAEKIIDALKAKTTPPKTAQ